MQASSGKRQTLADRYCYFLNFCEAKVYLKKVVLFDFKIGLVKMNAGANIRPQNNT